MQAPDLVEPVVGWRLWRISERRRETRLMSLFLDDVWPWLEPLEARCAIPRIVWRRRERRHSAPHEECDCGIHATLWATVAPQFRNAGRHRRPCFVVGQVALWGRVVECEFGWRSTFAYPKRMFALLPKQDSRDDQSEALRVVGALERYGVPVEPVELSNAAAMIEHRVGEL